MLSAVITTGGGYRAMPLARQLAHQRSVQPGPLVLGPAPLNSLTPTVGRDRPVSRRSEPSSRTALMGEQPNPWDLIQPQDAMSRHQGAEPCRRCELLDKTLPVIICLNSKGSRARVECEHNANDCNQLKPHA